MNLRIAPNYFIYFNSHSINCKIVICTLIAKKNKLENYSLQKALIQYTNFLHLISFKYAFQLFQVKIFSKCLFFSNFVMEEIIC